MIETREKMIESNTQNKIKGNPKFFNKNCSIKNIWSETKEGKHNEKERQRSAYHRCKGEKDG